MTTFQTVVPLEKLSYSSLNPRSAAKADKALIDSIKEAGILVPLICRPIGEKGLEVLDGNRRLDALLELSKLGIDPSRNEVPVHVVAMSDKEAVEFMLAVNTIREDMPTYDYYRSLFSLSVGLNAAHINSLAGALGVTPRQVEIAKSVMKLPKVWLTSLQKGLIGRQFAAWLAMIPKNILADMVTNDLLNPARLYDDKMLPEYQKRFTLQGKDLKKAVFRDTTAFSKDNVVQSTCVGCPQRSTGNPGLFGDTTQDLCLNRKCFETKTAAMCHQAYMEVYTQAKKTGIDVQGVVLRNRMAQDALQFAIPSTMKVINYWSEITDKMIVKKKAWVVALKVKEQDIAGELMEVTTEWSTSKEKAPEKDTKAEQARKAEEQKKRTASLLDHIQRLESLRLIMHKLSGQKNTWWDFYRVPQDLHRFSYDDLNQYIKWADPENYLKARETPYEWAAKYCKPPGMNAFFSLMLPLTNKWHDNGTTKLLQGMAKDLGLQILPPKELLELHSQKVKTINSTRPKKKGAKA